MFARDDEKVKRAVAELATPDMLAQSLRRRETLRRLRGGDVSNPLIGEIVTGAESKLGAKGYSMLLTNSVGEPQLEAEHVARLSQRRVDGLMISIDETHPARLGKPRARRPWSCSTASCRPSNGSRVFSDHRSRIRAAGLQALDLGHRRIGLIAGARCDRARAARRAGGGLRRARATGDVHRQRGYVLREHGAAAMRRLLDLPDPPTAMITGGNQLMLGALRVVRERGLTLGHDLSFVGCDDVAITDLFQPAVAVVRRDNYAMGRTAAELLLARLRDGAPPSRCRPPHGVRRQAELGKAAAVSGMRAGVGRADITPPVGIPAGGWGNQLHETSEGNDLELWATVLVVEGEGSKANGGGAAIVDVDLCILDDAQAARARSIVAQRQACR